MWFSKCTSDSALEQNITVEIVLTTALFYWKKQAKVMQIVLFKTDFNWVYC